MFKSGEFGGWVTSSAKTMQSMFKSSSFNGEIQAWDVSSVTDMGSMFLKNWMVMADMHRNFLKSMIEMNPLMPSMSSSKKSYRSEENEEDHGEEDGNKEAD